MKVTTLDNLRELLGLMEGTFGNKELSISHRNALNTYILNIDYEEDLNDNTSTAVLGIGKLGVLILGKSL